MADGEGAGAATIAEGDWRAELPEGIRGSEHLTNIKDHADLAQQFINQQPLIGADKLVVPGTDASDEQRREFYGKLGCPEAVGGYEVPTDNMPEGVELDAEQTKAFFTEAHDMGLSKQNTARLVRYQANMVDTAIKAQEEAAVAVRAETESKLKADWGEAYPQNIAMSSNAVEHFGGAELRKYLTDTGLGNHYLMVKAFEKIGRAIAEDEILGGGAGQGFVMSPENALAAIEAKKLDKDFMEAKNDNRHVGHKAAIDELEKLHKIAYPET